MSTQLPPPQKVPILKATNSSYSFEIKRNMYNEAEEPEYSKFNVATVETKFNLRTSGNYAKATRIISSNYDVDIVVAVKHQVEDVEPEQVKQSFRALAEKLCEEHPAISTYKGIFGGMPHIKDVRLSVGDILSKLYIYGSIQAILDIYAPDITQEQIKEAIAYAQDFLEAACDPRQSPQIDG